MPDPLSYSSRSARHNLPFLLVGQAQKEIFVNEALARLDLLVNPAIEGVASAPPNDPAEGSLYIVAVGATGEWSGRDGELAGWAAGAWLYQTPSIGCAVHDLSTGAMTIFDGQWRSAQAPALPTGGSTIDIEARNAIDTLIVRLGDLGIFSAG